MNHQQFSGFRALVLRVSKHLNCTYSQAHELLVDVIAVEVARQALLKQRRVAWPRLGTFRPFTTKAQRRDLTALIRAGHVPQGAPTEVLIPRMRRLRFRASRVDAVVKGVPL